MEPSILSDIQDPKQRRSAAEAKFLDYLRRLSPAESKSLRDQKYYRGRPEKDWPKAIETIEKSKQMALEAVRQIETNEELTALEEGGAEKAIELFITIITETLPEWWRYANEIDSDYTSSLRAIRNMLHEPYNTNYDDIYGLLYELPSIIDGLDFDILVPR